MAEESITFKAKIEKVVFYNDSSAWGVLSVSTDKNIPYSKCSYDYDIETNQTDSRYITTIVGKIPHPEIGMIFDVVAHHVFNSKYKQDQYEIESIFSNAPKTIADQKTYLQSILTLNQVDVLLENYPNIVQDVIDGKDEVDLNKLKGIGQYTWDKIKEKIVSNFAISDILSLLIPLGISFKKVQKLLDGEKNVQILKEKLIVNPYQLTNINGISFLTADKIAIKLNPSLKETEQRLKAFVKFCLEKVGDSDGHCWVTLDYLKNEIIQNIPECEKFLNSFIEAEKENPKLVHVDENKIGLLYYYNSEKFIYEFLNKVHNSVPLEITEENIINGITEAEKEQGFLFSEQQKNILYEMTKNNLNILSGFGGSGKSSLSRGILKIYENAGYSVSVSALSSKAAKRASEVTKAEGVTIHRLLESDMFSFNRNEKNKLKYDLYLLDEASMVNSYIFMSYFKAIDSEHSKVILVGDHFQLPPIQYGQVFTDLLTTENKFQKNVLTQIYRQANNSGIFLDAMKMRIGENPLTKEEMKSRKVIHGDGDMIYIFSDDKEYLHSMALSAYAKAVQEDGLENVVILSPRKKDVLNCTSQFNGEIQKIVNEKNLNNKFEFGKKKILLDDRVIQIANDKDQNIYNGYVGKVTKINQDNFESIFDENILAIHDKENINELELAYAISCHRSQGSEYDSVIVVLDMSSYMLLFSEMLYTARTRGKKRVLICAQPKAYEMCLNESKNKRNTFLKEFLSNNQPTQ